MTTSWDDGDPLDLRIATMLAQHGMTGTFYVPLCDPTRPRLRDSDLRDFTSSGFEIGSHGMLHRNLAKTRCSDLLWEITDSKTELQQIIGQEVSTFCYPLGGQNDAVIREVQRAGYAGARTIRMLSTDSNFDRLEVPTTIQAFRHNKAAYLKNLLRRGEVKDLFRYCATLQKCNSWVELGRRLFEHVLQYGGVWHLYGHSWEIEEHDLWGELDEMLAYVSGHEEVQYVRVVDTLRSRRAEGLAQIACPQVLSR